MVETLIELGVDPNGIDKTGHTPLMLALEQGENDEIIALLMDELNQFGVEVLQKSPEYMALLVDWFNELPEARMAVLTSNHHPLKQIISKNYPDDAAYLDAEFPRLTGRLSKAETEQNENNFECQF